MGPRSVYTIGKNQTNILAMPSYASDHSHSPPHTPGTYQGSDAQFAWKEIFNMFFTRGQFWPSGIVVACVCLCVCVSVNHELVRVIIHQPFKLGSPNLVQRSKTPWLRSLLFFGAIDLDLQGQI